MFGTIIAIGIVILLIIYIAGRARKTPFKDLVEIDSQDSLIRRLDLRPGEYVKLIVQQPNREVEVFSNRSPEGRDRLGVIRNYAIFKKIREGAAARIHSVNRNTILLQLVNAGSGDTSVEPV